MIPAMVILGELSDIFGDAQRGVWLEIRLRLRASSKLVSRHFLDRTRAFSGSRGAQPRRECQRKRFFRISLQISWRNRIALLCATSFGLLAKTEKRLRQLCPSDNVFKPDVRLLSRVHPKVALRALFLTLVITAGCERCFWCSLAQPRKVEASR